MLKSSMNPQDLELSSYRFDLPLELIAQRPAPTSRLLVYKVSTNEIIHDTFDHLDLYLPKESLLVFNRSKVFPSRLIGTKESGGKAELFLLATTPNENGVYPALIKTRSKKKLGDCFKFPDDVTGKICEIKDDTTFGVEFSIKNLFDYLEKHAKIPIPPYIRKGESDEEDKHQYQTVYAKEVGSVAAPTAGLHFKEPLLLKLKEKKIETCFVTLHVGLGTFKPVTASHLKDHKMHSEKYFIDHENFNHLLSARKKKQKIFAVGTTSLRVLESSFDKEMIPNNIYETNIFLHPGVDVLSIDGLITNFHLPESTLLMLVSSLIGREKTLELYQEAIKERYRFFSYGDGMLILR